jgi:hypothetical protein
MLVYGTANPVGYGDEDYQGLYLTDRDLDAITPTIVGTPVKIEHKGADVGRVVSAWKHAGRLDLVLDIDGEGIESVFGREFVKRYMLCPLVPFLFLKNLTFPASRGLCKDLSLGYNVQMSRSPAGFLRASNKRVVEVSSFSIPIPRQSLTESSQVSLVKVGARENCHIHGWNAQAGGPPQAPPRAPAEANKPQPPPPRHVILP